MCTGCVLLYRCSDPGNPKKDIRAPCRLCGTKTNFYCSGCKNYLCCGTQGIDEKKARKIADAVEDNITMPRHHLKIPIIDKTKEGSWSYIFAANSCYHVMHDMCFDDLEF